MDWLRHDLRHALRALRRRPAFAALAILTLALGLGINTVAFSALNALIYKPFRFDGADRLGWLFVGRTGDAFSDTSLPIFDRVAADARTLDAVAAEGRLPLALTSDGASEQVWALIVSADYFSVVAAAPRLGRLIGRGDGDRGDVPIVVSERFWRRRLDATADLTARTIVLNQQLAHVVGVLPDSFQGPGGVFEPDVWVPLAARHTLALPARYDDARTTWLSLVARPRAGVTREAVEAEVLAIANGVDADAGLTGITRRVSYERLIDRHPEVRQIARGGLVALSLVVLVLLIACFNVAGLVLARSAERRRELSVRAALGAGRWRLARELLTEGLVLAAAAGMAALLVANWSAALLSVFSLPAPIPQRLHFVMDWRVFAFAAAAVALAALLPAVAPLLQLLRADLARALTGAGTARAGAFAQRRTRRAFVVVQVAGSTFLLVSALVFARHFIGQLQLDHGFDDDRLAVMQIDPTQYGYGADAARDLARRVVASVSSIPGAVAAAAADRVPFAVGAPATRTISADGRDCTGGGCTTAVRYAVDGSYFEVLGIDLVDGRAFHGDGSSELDGVVINRAAADALWPARRAVGQALKVEPDGVWLRVIGVAADVRDLITTQPPRPAIYQPIAADPSGRVLIVARAAADPAALLLPMRQAVHAIDPRVPPASVQTMAERMALPLWPSRTSAGFAGVCGAVAVALSAIGLFGVTWFTVHQRRREFGVRMAIGASGGRVQRQVVAEALRLAAPGIAVGMAGAVLAMLALRAVLPAFSAADAAPFAVAAAAQGAMCALASWTPARRAARANPVEVLRAE
jgi:predicted permease